MTASRLRQDYPQLYPASLPDHLLDVPEGWGEIIRKLSERIKNEPVRVLQVKEKSGGLRFYFSGASNLNVNSAVMEAEDASWVTCAVCGSAGALRETESGWFKVRCDEHAAGTQIVDPLRRDNLPVAVRGLHAPRRDGIARGFVTLDEWTPNR